MSRNKELKEIARLFTKLGWLGFGGPAVHIAMMEEEVVKKRQWITHEHFLDLIGATNLIPGPNSTEMALHIGHERAGWRGLLVAGFCFISPAVFLTAIIAWAYQRYGALPQVAPVLYGIKPAVIAIIISLMITLGKKALKSVELGIIAVIAAGLSLLGVNDIYVLFGAGFTGIALHYLKKPRTSVNSLMPVGLLQIKTLMPGLSSWKLFLIFLKVGSILYGSGYVLFAFLDSELVGCKLLTKKQLIDAIAVGQFTPGPVFSSATFIGWQISSLPGAIAATIGIFLPSFLFVAFLNPFIPKLRRSKAMSAFLDFVNMASVAIILAVCVTMTKDAVTDWKTIMILAVSLTVTFLFKKLNNAFVVLGGAALGYLLSFV